jgi:hypothetical protein
MAADIVITPQTIHVNLSPVGFRLWAQQFLACRRTFVPPAEGFSPVPFFLDCRAIELELKARHLESVTPKVVKDKYGHNLERSYQNLPKGEQTLSPAELRVLQAANNIYKAKASSTSASSTQSSRSRSSLTWLLWMLLQPSWCRVTPNPSLKAPTRYGSHRLAASGLCQYHPCAASRRLPPRSA